MVGDVRGIGPMLALELVEDRQTKKPAGDAAQVLVNDCRDRGLVLLTCGSHGNVVRVLLPLVISAELLERGLGILEEGLAVLTAA